MSKNNLDRLIDLMIEYTYDDEELDEQGETASTGGGSAKPPYPTVTKWETGLTRGPANQIALSKWSDIVKLTRGKANTLL
jgi:hypothetical protein